MGDSVKLGKVLAESLFILNQGRLLLCFVSRGLALGKSWADLSVMMGEAFGANHHLQNLTGFRL